MTSSPKTTPEASLQTDAGISYEQGVIRASCDALNSLATVAHSRMVDAGFWERRYKLIALLDHSPDFKLGEGTRLIAMEAIALIMSELGEAVEGIRKNANDQHLPSRSSLAVELADAVIRILDLSAGLKLDVPKCIEEKMEYNRAQRGKMHGKLS